MNYPYAKYAAYLAAIEEDLDDLLHPFPAPKVGNLVIEYKIPKRYSKDWIKSMGLTPLEAQSDVALVAYTLWRNTQYRSLMLIAKLRGMNDIPKYVSTRLHFEITDEAADFFYDVFMNFDGWSVTDIIEYAEEIGGKEDASGIDEDSGIIDGVIIPLCYSNTDITYLLSKAGIVNNCVDHSAILNEVFVESYRMFKDATLPDEKIKTGSFLLKTHREITTAKTDLSTEFQEELSKYKLTIKRLKYNHNVVAKPRTKEEYEQMSIFQQGQSMGVEYNVEHGKE